MSDLHIDTDLSVIIPTIGRTERLRDLLGSIERQVCFTPFEVLVVANLPDISLRKMVESFGPRFRYLETGRLDVNIARNKGLERARGRLALFLDDDCYLLDRYFFQKHIQAHTEHPDADGIGGHYQLEPGASRVAQAYHWILECDLSRSLFENKETMTLLGGNCSFKRSRLRHQLHFPEGHHVAGSFQVLTARLIKSGRKLIFKRDLAVEHRRHLNLFELIQLAFAKGWSQKNISNLGLAPERKAWRQQLSRQKLALESGGDARLSLPIFTLYDHFHQFGSRFGAGKRNRNSDAASERLVDRAADHFPPDRSSERSSERSVDRRPKSSPGGRNSSGHSGSELGPCPELPELSVKTYLIYICSSVVRDWLARRVELAHRLVDRALSAARSLS